MTFLDIINCLPYQQQTTKLIFKKSSFYIAQYPVRWTVQSALHFLHTKTLCILVMTEWLRAWDTLDMFEATVCGRS